MKYVIGVDIGGTKTAYGVFDENRQLIAGHRHDSDPGLPAGDFFDIVAATIRRLCSEYGITEENLLGAGVAAPSFIDFESGFIRITSNLVNIKDFPALAYLSEKLGGKTMIVLDNDAHAAALAEHRHGAGRGFEHMLFCPVSTGISSAIIINKQLFRGSYGWAGESGHAIATPGFGIPCGCGNAGCYMSWTSGSMLPRHVRGWIEGGEETILTSYASDPSQITMEHIDSAFERGDAVAARAVEQMIKYMAAWTFNLYVVLNINCFVFGGGLLKLKLGLIERVKAAFDSYNQTDMPVHFKTAMLGDKAGIIGASELIFCRKGL